MLLIELEAAPNQTAKAPLENELRTLNTQIEVFEKEIEELEPKSTKPTKPSP